MSATKAKYKKLIGELIIGHHYSYMIYGLEKRGGRWLYQCIFVGDEEYEPGNGYTTVVDAKTEYWAWEREKEYQALNDNTQEKV